MNRLDGKVVLITGSTRGLGRGMSRFFAQEGARLIITDRDDKHAAATLEDLDEIGAEAIFVQADLSVENDVVNLIDKAVAHYGRLTTVINNAALMPRVLTDASVVDIDNATLEAALGVNYYGLIWTCKYAIPHLLEAEGASITNISSFVTELGGPHFTAYCTTKAVMEPLTRSLARRYAADALRVNCIICGAVETPENAKALRDTKWFEDNQVDDRLPLLPYFGRIDDMAYAAIYLSSDEARFVTNANLAVNGGVTK